MPKIGVNLAVEASSGYFCHVKVGGPYTMRIETVEERTSKEGKPYLSWRLSHVATKDQLTGVDGKPLEGPPSSVFYSTRTDAEAQSMLRSLVEAALGQWREFDTEELLGKEIDVSLKFIPENVEKGYKAKNEIARIVKKA